MAPKRIVINFKKKYGRLTPIQEITPDSKKATRWLFKCDCGKSVQVYAANIVSGATQSCGCLNSELVIKRNLKHGDNETVEYRAWLSMRRRCNNSNYENYSYYGGRGIRVCDRWLNSFENFYEDMGEKPWPKKLYSLDRINNDGNYEPSNCRWATWKQQNRNRRYSKK